MNSVSSSPTLFPLKTEKFTVTLVVYFSDYFALYYLTLHYVLISTDI